MDFVTVLRRKFLEVEIVYCCLCKEWPKGHWVTCGVVEMGNDQTYNIGDDCSR